jgi:hypothetical protein
MMIGFNGTFKFYPQSRYIQKWEEIRHCRGGIIKAEEDKLDFLLLSSTTSELTLILVHDTMSYCVLQMLNEGGQWNDYRILSKNKTVYIIKNGNFIERCDNLDLRKITAKISSDDSSWKIRNVCGDGAVEPCKITCTNYEDFNNETEEESKESSPNSSGGSRLPLNIVVFLVLTVIPLLGSYKLN